MPESIVLSAGELGHIRDRFLSLKRAKEAALKHGERVVGNLIHSGTTVGFALLTGMAQTRWAKRKADGSDEVGTEFHGIPLDLIGGLLLKGADLFQVTKYHEEIGAAGTGMLAGYLTMLGQRWGHGWKEKAEKGKPAGAKTSGEDRLTDAEIDDLRARELAARQAGRY